MKRKRGRAGESTAPRRVTPPAGPGLSPKFAFLPFLPFAAVSLPPPSAPTAASAASRPTPLAAASGPAPAKPASWLRRKLIQPLLDLLQSGLSPAKLALTVGLGVAFGLGPLLGVTTLISSVVALRLRLNVAAMQLVCHLLSPLQLILLLPLLRVGATVLGQGHLLSNMGLTQLRQQIATDGWGVLHLLWRAEVGALLVWALVAAPVVGLLYVGLQPVFKKVLVRQRAAAIAGLRAARSGAQGSW